MEAGKTRKREVKRNWQLIFGLIYQNKPGRINRNLLELPVIYEFYIEGMAYMPYSYISKIQVDFIGNRRTMGIDIPSFGDVGENENGTGNAEAHNNLQPYIVVHMWKRTA